MPAPLIFITGATGFIGSATALEALKSGYRLRIGVRKRSERLEALLFDYAEHLEFVIIPDITEQSAFAGKLDGVDYVIHLASPLAKGTDKEAFFGPAVKGTLAVLREAAKVPSVKKVVVTSSIASLIPLAGIPDDDVIREDTNWDLTVDENADFVDPDHPEATPMTLYRASKLLANNATWDFYEAEKPHYALVTLHPAFVYGHNLLQASAEEVQGGTNGLLWGSIMGGIPLGGINGVHIQDVAEAHVKALGSEIQGGSKYLLSGPGTSWKEVAGIARKFYLNAGVKLTEDTEGTSMPTDTTKAERELGMRWRSWEEMVRGVMDQQLGFLQG
ncbi:hypothetical protein BDW74DRAFT_164861 [Aspergillus multicolor]|uniref:uncharacterized protein n=1 Tax=Aspergillus multicolor TaxID=41759 RepID=UPI003CCD9774